MIDVKRADGPKLARLQRLAGGGNKAQAVPANSTWRSMVTDDTSTSRAIPRTLLE
jgi:hypothetical protein